MEENINAGKQENAGSMSIDFSGTHMKKCFKYTLWAQCVPLPLILVSIAAFFYYQPKWFLDPFLWMILLLFTAGQSGAFFQFRSLSRITGKVQKVLAVLKNAGDCPDLLSLRKELLEKAPPSVIRDNVLRWVELGLQGETDGLQSMMDRAAIRRDQESLKVMSFHNLINRITLKFGFLGTLMGLMMTFEPMKQAMLSLQLSDGEFRFITDIVKAIDGDAYAILTTLYATGLSVFIELFTIQLFERFFVHFEMINNNLDDWCVIRLQPWIKKKYGDDKGVVGKAFFGQGFTEQFADVQKAMGEQVRQLSNYVSETSRQMAELAPLQKNMIDKIRQLVEYEKQYRQFLSSKLQSLAPETKTETDHE